eukprot:m51a1_g11607 hypothetical protein (411) ;mRNA; f:161470-172514
MLSHVLGDGRADSAVRLSHVDESRAVARVIAIAEEGRHLAASQSPIRLPLERCYYLASVVFRGLPALLSSFPNIVDSFLTRHPHGRLDDLGDLEESERRRLEQETVEELVEAYVGAVGAHERLEASRLVGPLRGAMDDYLRAAALAEAQGDDNDDAHKALRELVVAIETAEELAEAYVGAVGSVGAHERLVGTRLVGPLRGAMDDYLRTVATSVPPVGWLALPLGTVDRQEQAQSQRGTGDHSVNDRFRVIDEKEDVMSSQAPVPSPAPKKKKKKVSTGHAEELPPSMSLNQINAQYKFSEVTNISFGDIFGHVFERVIGVQAVVQQYMAAKKHGHSTMFEQEIPVICYGSGSNASYLQLDHNHYIISILFIHVMEHYNFQLPVIMMPVPLIMYFGKAINEITTAAHHET